MKSILLLISLLLALYSSGLVAAEESPILQKVAAALAPVLDKLDPKPEVKSEDGNSMLITYRARLFKIHAASLDGEFSKEAHDEIGPDSKGFVLQLGLASKDDALQIAVPQGGQREAYWTTDLDEAPMRGTDRQLYWRFSYGARTDKGLRAQIETVLRSFKN